MFSSRTARLLTVFAAIIGVSGLSLLPAEHVHPDQHDGNGHQSAIVHRHVTAHHQHASVTLPHQPNAARATWQAGDDHANAWQSTLAWVTAGSKPAPSRPLLTSPYLAHDLPDSRGDRGTAVVPWVPPPHGPPFDAARPLRAPPSLA